VEVQDARGAMPCKLRQDDHDKVQDEYVQISSPVGKSPDGWNKTSLQLRSQYHPRTCNQNKHLLHSLLQVTTKPASYYSASKIHQTYFILSIFMHNKRLFIYLLLSLQQ